MSDNFWWWIAFGAFFILAELIDAWRDRGQKE